MSLALFLPLEVQKHGHVNSSSVSHLPSPIMGLGVGWGAGGEQEFFIANQGLRGKEIPE